MSEILNGAPEWSDLYPVAVVVAGDGFPPEVLPGDTIICRGDNPAEITAGALALVVVTIFGNDVELVRRVYAWRGKLIVMPDPRAQERPVVVMRDKLKVYSPVLEIRRRFEVSR